MLTAHHLLTLLLPYNALKRHVKGNMAGISRPRLHEKGIIHTMGTAENTWIKLEITTPPEFVEPIASLLEDNGAPGCYQELNFVGDNGDWDNGDEGIPTFAEPLADDMLAKCPLAGKPTTERLIVHIPDDACSEKIITILKNYLHELRELFPTTASFDIAVQIIENPDWNEAWKQYFKPLRIGKNIVVKPSWEPLQAASNIVVIEIDPGMAFGTGQHASTRLCLEAMETLFSARLPEHWRMLDWGTGTGILAIYGAKMSIEDVTAIDADRAAVAIAKENALINRVSERIAFRVQDTVSSKASYNLIVANLTAKLLLDKRHDIINALADNGYLIISGILAANGNELEKAFAASLGGGVYQKLVDDGWVCYLMQKQG